MRSDNNHGRSRSARLHRRCHRRQPSGPEVRTLTQPPAPPGRQDVRPRRSFLGWLARATLRHRKWVIAAWAVAFIVGAFAASHISSRLSVDFSCRASRATRRAEDPGDLPQRRRQRAVHRGRVGTCRPEHRAPAKVAWRRPSANYERTCPSCGWSTMGSPATGPSSPTTVRQRSHCCSSRRSRALAPTPWPTRLELWSAGPCPTTGSASPGWANSKRAARQAAPGCSPRP